MTNYNPAFITGSHAYGVPYHNSDVDLVILADQETVNVLYPIHRVDPNPMYEDSRCLRFGKLNIIAVGDQAEYDLWKKCTDELIARKPVTKKEAIEHFQKAKKVFWDERRSTKKLTAKRIKK